MTEADILDRVTLMAKTPEGRAALTGRGLSVDCPRLVPLAEDVIGPTPAGSQEPTDLQVENLVAQLPTHLHAALAQRLVQPGVADISAGSAGAAAVHQQRQGRSARNRDGHGQIMEDESNTREGSRSPRRQEDY